MTSFGPPVSIKEASSEVKEKLRQDLSRWSRVRRLASVKPMMGCMDCDATGRISCFTCGGTGQSKVVFGETAETCATCQGKGTVTCATCGGRGLVPNVHRKKILWLLGLGGLAWLFVLWSLWQRDILPEQQANLLHGGGGGRSSGPAAPGSRGVSQPGLGPGAMGQPAGTMPVRGNPANSSFGMPGGPGMMGGRR